MKILLVDDDKIVCQALKTILEAENDIEIPAIGNDGTHAIDLYFRHQPDILLMDIRMTVMTGIEAGQQIIAKDPDAKILYLTTFADNEYIVDALKLGAKGYLLKQDFESIIPAIRAVSIGQRVFGDEIISKIPGMMVDSDRSSFEQYGLTDKEIEMITLIADGLSNKEIASNSFLSEGTVRNYISTILEKLDLRDRTQLAIFYYKNK
ncbi:MAG TPA: response regulator transcription factor [Lachnospiraceae bacterium]|jgi:DNA-binding NarL/FixJ family response regulator|nr:response regulator transcription factor [Lachnospiraceae bacterium]